MFRYILFANDVYYPVHGMWGCKLRTNNLEEVRSFPAQFESNDGYGYDFYQYYDTQTGEVYEYRGNSWKLSDMED